LVLHSPDEPHNYSQRNETLKYDPIKWFDGDWIIHGHTHINSPFIDIHRKRVNVCVEAINYAPISMEEIYKTIQDSKTYNDNRWIRC